MAGRCAAHSISVVFYASVSRWNKRFSPLAFVVILLSFLCVSAKQKNKRSTKKKKKNLFMEVQSMNADTLIIFPLSFLLARSMCLLFELYNNWNINRAVKWIVCVADWLDLNKQCIFLPLPLFMSFIFYFSLSLFIARVCSRHCSQKGLVPFFSWFDGFFFRFQSTDKSLFLCPSFVVFAPKTQAIDSKINQAKRRFFIGFQLVNVPRCSSLNRKFRRFFSVHFFSSYTHSIHSATKVCR